MTLNELSARDYGWDTVSGKRVCETEPLSRIIRWLERSAKARWKYLL
jgi:hypothetical protein